MEDVTEFFDLFVKFTVNQPDRVVFVFVFVIA
jgi:hypothetical protein